LRKARRSGVKRSHGKSKKQTKACKDAAAYQTSPKAKAVEGQDQRTKEKR